MTWNLICWVRGNILCMFNFMEAVLSLWKERINRHFALAVAHYSYQEVGYLMRFDIEVCFRCVYGLLL